ncbi:MAG: beta-ketoacyl synthase [Crocinitomicaceae bacterium]|nr:beta-ketoacyl synthase [Crocinitomicaceae bacterium]
MMKNNVYFSYGTFVSPIGIGVDQNFEALKEGNSGIQAHPSSGFNNENWFFAQLNNLEGNRYDSLLKTALNDLKVNYSSSILSSSKTLFILSSTKGNIYNLPEDVFASSRIIIQQETGNSNELIIVSNACISGVIALNTATDFLRYSDYETVIVIGIDVISDFVLYGFQSLYALSDQPVQPFDKDRKGISLGEACGIIVATKEKPTSFSVEYLGGASSNDANHISGPSRTGEGLYRAINKTIERAAIDKSSIDFISAHGTGTLYNDEMESIAFNRCDLQSIPINSLKGFYGHTLGAAGIIETIVSMLSIEHQLLIENKGFNELGTTHSLNIVTKTQQQPVKTVLKTASGFGGGNAVLLIQAAV